ncbi:MAG: hypothetical protein H7250_00140 [Flavobacterium sp.]|nr:hypothetical protein [Flavobacterium sp.]
MGKTTDSFNRELGKNTGKAVSNFLFGNKHATPIKLIREAKVERIQEQQRIERNLLEENHKLEIKQQQFREIGELSMDTNSRISTILNMQFPTTENELFVMMNDLKSHIYVYGWKSSVGLNSFNGKQNRLNNKLSNIILRKFNQGLQIMEKDFPNNIEFDSYKKLSKISKLKKYFIQYLFLIIPLLFIISVYILDFVQRNF